MNDVETSVAATSGGTTASGLFNRMKIRTKLILILLVFGLVPAITLFGILFSQGTVFHKALSAGLEINAKKAIEVVERNLFERYGDVQAFALNTAALDKSSWGDRSGKTPLVNAMNGYTTGYGIYRFMVLVDPSGKTLAVNSVDLKGQPLNTGFL